MKRSAIQRRLARLQQECEVSAAPAISLLAACSVLALASGLNALLQEAPDEQQPGQLTRQEPPPASLRCPVGRGIAVWVMGSVRRIQVPGAPPNPPSLPPARRFS